MIQKNIFLNDEGNNWFLRNQEALNQKNFESDYVCSFIKNLSVTKGSTILEVGCSAGNRLMYLTSLGYDCIGIEPSLSAVAEAKSKGLNIIQSTADNLIIVNDSVDVLIFGFCLYLVDPSDYFKIASEAYRVLKNNGLIIINDFSPKMIYKKAYSHKKGVFSYNYDFVHLFLVHPHMVLLSKVMETHNHSQEDVYNQDEWVQISVIRKQMDLF